MERRLAALDIRVAGEADIVVRPAEAERVATHPVGPAGELESRLQRASGLDYRDHGRRAGRPPGALFDDTVSP